MIDDLPVPDYVEVGVLLPGERCGGQVFGRRTRTHRARPFRTQPGHGAADRRLDIGWHRSAFEGRTQLCAQRADGVVVVGVQPGQPLQQGGVRRDGGDEPIECLHRHTESGWHRKPVAREFAQPGGLAADQRLRAEVDRVEIRRISRHHSPIHPLSPVREAIMGQKSWPHEGRRAPVY